MGKGHSVARVVIVQVDEQVDDNGARACRVKLRATSRRAGREGPVVR